MMMKMMMIDGVGNVDQYHPNLRLIWNHYSYPPLDRWVIAYLDCVVHQHALIAFSFAYTQTRRLSPGNFRELLVSGK